MCMWLTRGDAWLFAHTYTRATQVVGLGMMFTSIMHCFYNSLLMMVAGNTTQSIPILILSTSHTWCRWCKHHLQAAPASSTSTADMVRIVACPYHVATKRVLVHPPRQKWKEVNLKPARCKLLCVSRTVALQVLCGVLWCPAVC